MRILFIRHGESVDNVAGLYAGSRDSPLTAHGALQARRLASSLAQSVVLTHVFSSKLQRAAKTAAAFCDAQNEAHGAGLAVIAVPELCEKHFGSAEGVSFRSSASDRLAFDDAETAQSMRVRASRFLDEHLVPLPCADAATDNDMACAIVAHGIILGALVKVLVERIPRSGVVLPPAPERNGLVMDGSGPILPSWSNTGYLEIVVSRQPVSAASGTPKLPLQLHIKRVNCTSHLENIHKTRGGIGSAAYDERQRTMDHFFAPASRGHKPRDATS
ncbi:putative phosphatase [Tolypocladium ophioglossoides CBS 100239]|uniref:Putative phosphatase n=1 Tax=Tolypocladium ophioglossoides (strain CBS 100239) TaxID=1163406 RepID=A0A0L0N0R1_TOLOC|nr:putative phosphatase [Tolypocladium ophioglossoides CBS 100239]